jgi:hypothetical protein
VIFDAELRILGKNLFIVTLSPGRGESVETGLRTQRQITNYKLQINLERPSGSK